MFVRRAFTMVEILVVIVVIAVIAAVVLPRYLGGRDATGKKTKTPIAAARGTVCQSNLQQLRQAISMFQLGDADSAYPSSIEELREIPAEMRKCDAGGEAYRYDLSTGKVSCPHPGHESF